MAYIGPEPNPGQNREVDDISSSFNGSTTAFTLQVNSQNVSPGSSNNIIVSLGGVVQNPGTDYNIAASTITFTTAPASGLSFFGLVLGQQVDIQSLADGTSPTMSAPTITGDLSIADKIVHTGDTNTAIRFSGADTITAETGGSARLTIASDGNVGIGEVVPIGKLHVSTADSGATAEVSADELVVEGSAHSGITILSGTGSAGCLNFGDSGDNDIGRVIYHHATNHMQFNTNGSERMRIESNGDFEFNGIGTATPGYGNTTMGMGFEPRNGSIFLSRSDGAPLFVNTNTTDVDIVKFSRDGTLRGRVFMQTTSVSYATTSDYRLKENQVLISDGITRLKTLKPYRFNFIEEPSKTVDGFFAHEVTAVPEAVSGTKDAVDSDGNIEPQGLDYGRITPLLTAALQEAIVKIETLETKVAALEAA